MSLKSCVSVCVRDRAVMRTSGWQHVVSKYGCATSSLSLRLFCQPRLKYQTSILPHVNASVRESSPIHLNADA